MALSFSSAAGSVVDCGSAASLDNLQAGANGFTVVAWIMRTADGYDKAIVSKFTSASAGWVLFCEGVPPGYTTFGGLRMQVFRGTGFGDQTTYETSDRITKDAWMFVAGTFKDSASPKMHLYYGSLTATVVEETSYQISSAGTGTLNSDAANNLWIGDGQDNFGGNIERVGIYNTELALADIRALQFAPISQWNRSDCVLLQQIGDSSKTQPDLCGDGNNGTVTSASDVAGLPLIAHYGAMDYGANWANAAAATFQNLVGRPFSLAGVHGLAGD